MALESLASKQRRAEHIIRLLLEDIPEPKCALLFETPFQLLVATILSAQCTDERVNKVTPMLFSKAPTPESMIALGLTGIKRHIKSVNFFNNKAKNILAASKKLVANFNSQLPQTIEEMIQLPGVGRKTANVVLGTIYQIPGIVVDTHVIRLSNRLDFVSSKNPEDIERRLEKIIDKKNWINFSHLMVLHGRKTCKALQPQCTTCIIQAFCPSKSMEPRAWEYKK